MALGPELYRLLVTARRQESEGPRAHELLDRLLALHQQARLLSLNNATDMNLSELLVLTAEAAIVQNDFETGWKCITWFDSECHARNQFYCRLQLVRARCIAHTAQSLTGNLKLKKVAKALEFILDVIPVALEPRKRPTYDFLVYNASVTYWHVARELMKQTTFQFLVPSLSKLIDALKVTDEKDVAWLLRLQLALVYAQLDAQQWPNAAKIINDIVNVQMRPWLTESDKGGNGTVKALYEEALRLQVHVGSFQDAECQKIVPNVKRLVPPTDKRSALLVKLQCITSANLSESLEAAYVEIFQQATGFVAFTLETTLDQVQTFVEALELHALNAMDMEIIVETGIHAALHNVVPIATACSCILHWKRKRLSSKVRVLCQVLEAILLVETPFSYTGDKRNSLQRQSMMLSRRVEGIKVVERALRSSKRQEDFQLIERVCIYAWNLSIPLLQPPLRHHLVHLLTLISSVLEEIDSLLLELRARVYLEISKLDTASEFLVKASTNINKALALDYGKVPVSAKTIETLSSCEDWLTRPLDRHLHVMKDQLDARLTASSSPLSATAAIWMMLEQVQREKELKHQRSTLSRCIDLMLELAHPSESSLIAVQLKLWSEIISFAWTGLHDEELTQKTIEMVLPRYFGTGDVGTVKSSAKDQSLMLVEVEMRLLLVDVLAARIKNQALEVEKAQQKSLEARSSSHDAVLLEKHVFVLGMKYSLRENDDLLEQPVKSIELQSMKSEILAQLRRALKVAETIGWTFVVENTGISLWNYHFHLIVMLLESPSISISSTDKFTHEWILPDCLLVFETLYAALEVISSRIDATLLATIGLGLACIYEKSNRLDKALAIADTFLKRNSISSGSYSRGMSLLHLKRFAELKSRVQIAQNAKEITPAESTVTSVKIIAYLEALEVSFNQAVSSRAQPFEKAQEYYQKAMALWQPHATEMLKTFMSNDYILPLEEEQEMIELYVEIWTRFGCAAFCLEKKEKAIEWVVHALAMVNPHESKKTKQKTAKLVLQSTWKWFAVAELLYGRTIMALTGSNTPSQKLILASLAHLEHSIEYALRGNTSLLVLRACAVVWNAAIPAVNHSFSTNELVEDKFLDHVAENLIKTLRYLDQVIDSSEADVGFYGKLVLLTLNVCEKAEKWSEQFKICEAVLKPAGSASVSQRRRPLPREMMIEIQTAAAIARARLGKPIRMAKRQRSSDSLQESLVQAQIWKKVAFASWKDPSAQLTALSSAYTELDGQAEEQALVLMDIAEWLFTNQFPSPDADAYLECAISTLLNTQKPKELSLQAVTSPRAVKYSPLWFAEKSIRAFVMRAMLSKTYTERSKHVRLAQCEVENAWEYMILLMNEMELKAAFDVDQGSNNATTLIFEEWKKTKTPKHRKPASAHEWLSFLIEHEEKVATRFYTPWARLLSLQNSDTLHVTQPVLMLFYLEKLLHMLRNDGLQYSSILPVFCLYAVVFYAYIPEQTYIARIWLNLVQFDLMERLNMKTFTIPLQDALEMVQSNEELVRKELQEAKALKKPSEDNVVFRKRHIYCPSRLDIWEKTVASIRLFVKFGFVRQGKMLLQSLQLLVEMSMVQGNENSVLTSEWKVLSSYVLDLEGQKERAFAQVKSALDAPQLDVCCFLKWTLRCCKLSPSLDHCLCLLKAAEKQAAATIVTGMQRRVSQTPQLMTVFSDAATSDSSDIEVVELMARVAFREAVVWLEKATLSEEADVLSLLQESKHALNKSVELLTLLEAHYRCSDILQTYSKALYSFEQKRGAEYLTNADVDPKRILEKASTLAQSCLERHFRFSSMSFTPTSGAFVSPLELKIAGIKLQLARVLMAPALSSSAVQEKEMTWYRYHEDTERTVVEKWLKATEPDWKHGRLLDYPRAMTLLTSAINVFQDDSASEIQLAIAQVLRLQCQRLALLHGEDRARSHAISHLLWTSYTSSDARYKTWVCCHGTQATLLVDTSENPVEVQDQNQNQMEGNSREEDEANEHTRLETMLAANATQLEQYQVIAVENQSTELLQLCSYELIQVLGCRKPFDCAMSILMHQSAQVNQVATQLFETCVLKSNVQYLHLQRMKKLEHVHRNAKDHSLPFQLSHLYLCQESEAFKRMRIGTQVDTIVTALPSLLRVLCLHFSSDRCFLYAALVGSTQPCAAVARMEFTETHTALLEQLQKRIESWRLKCGNETVAYEEAHKHDEAYEFMLEETVASSSLEERDQDTLEDEFTIIIRDTIELFHPLFTHSSMKFELESNLAGNTLVLLLDRSLASLPMEALPVFEPADGIGRDFSIQILSHRLVTMKDQPSSSNDVRVILDPYNEDGSGQTIQSIVEESGLKWKDAVEHKEVPSGTDWLQALSSPHGGSLLYVGPNRVLGSFLPLHQVTGMNVASTCQVLLFLDHAENSMSRSRQSKLDREKEAWENQVECDPHARALLLTLCGVNVLMMNQWTTTFNNNRRLTRQVLDSISKHKCLGKALQETWELQTVAPDNPPGFSSANESITESADGKRRLKDRFRYNCVIYGLAHLPLTSGA